MSCANPSEKSAGDVKCSGLGNTATLWRDVSRMTNPMGDRPWWHGFPATRLSSSAAELSVTVNASLSCAVVHRGRRSRGVDPMTDGADVVAMGSVVAGSVSLGPVAVVAVASDRDGSPSEERSASSPAKTPIATTAPGTNQLRPGRRMAQFYALRANATSVSQGRLREEKSPGLRRKGTLDGLKGLRRAGAP
jgi:hypothetical protein